jgi:hypothetical protein
VEKGEELLTEYAHTAEMTRHQRQEYLRNNYNFECKCAACTLPEKESLRLDGRLTTLAQMIKRIDDGMAGDGLETTRLINQILQLTKEERIPCRYAPCLCQEVTQG